MADAPSASATLAPRRRWRGFVAAIGAVVAATGASLVFWPSLAGAAVGWVVLAVGLVAIVVAYGGRRG